MRLYLVRHAKPKIEKDQLYKHANITDFGKEQAKRTAKFLKNKNIEVIFCSSVKRALQTLDFIKGELGEINTIISDEIIERNWGVFEEYPLEDLYKAIKKSGMRGRDFIPQGGESFFDMQERAAKFFENLKKSEFENIAVITHGGFIIAFLLEILKISYEESKFIAIKTCSITTLEFDDSYNVKDYNINNCDHFLKYRK